MPKKRTNFDDSLAENLQAYNLYLDRLTELSMTVFKWNNLPPTVDQRFLELTLFKDGQAIFFNDEDLGYLGLQTTTNGGGFTVYRVPIKRRAYAVNGYQLNLDNKNSVIVYNNYLRKNSYSGVKYFAKRLANIDRLIDINANAQKTPILVQGTETQRLTLLNLYKEYDGNAPVIFGDKNLDINSLKALSTNAPYVADKLYDLKKNIWSDALTYLGINNVDTKKERMLSSEVNLQQGDTTTSRYSRLEARREACDQINRMFGLDISVDYRTEFIDEDGESIEQVDNETGGKADE